MRGEISAYNRSRAALTSIGLSSASRCANSGSVRDLQELMASKFTSAGALHGREPRLCNGVRMAEDK
jgi:hypothetical protein